MESENSLKAAKERYVKGEISRAAYLKVKKRIEEGNIIQEQKPTPIHHTKTEEKVILLFGRGFKPRFFIIVGGIITIVIAILLLNANSTVSNISSSYINSAQSIAGNGKAGSISVSATSQLGTALSGAQIQASASTGTVNGCTTDNSGQCSIIYIPPKQATSSYATITLSIGTVTKSMSVKINPDPTAFISTSPVYIDLQADGSTSSVITINAQDNSSSPVPDGTQMSFSLSGDAGGSISATSCSTVDGQCKITYTASTNGGNEQIEASSYNATASVQITLTALPPSSISLSSSNSTIKGDGKSTSTITAKVTNKLGGTVGNTGVSFYTDEGSVMQICTTDSSGTCSVTYSSPNQAGIATINAYVSSNSSVSASIPITLIGVSNLQVQFYATPDIGNPIVPAFAINTAYLGTNMTTIQITNTGSGTFSGTVSLSIPAWSSSVSQYINVPAQSTIEVHLNPNLDSQVFSNVQAQAVTYQLTITDSQNNNVYQNSYPANLTSFNTMDWYSPQDSTNMNYYDNIIAAWVTPDIQSVHSLVSDAAQYAPGKSMQGYITYSSGCGFLGGSPCDEFNSTYLQLQALWEEEQSLGLHYVNAPNNFAGSQTVYTPAQSLTTGGQNCIDGTLVFASAVSSMGMQSYIALVPGHAFVCVAQWYGSSTVLCVETTMVGGGYSFSQAYQEGNSEFSYYQNRSEMGLINVNQVLSSGVKSLPSG